ncbi:MAG: YeeE/YedE thiosulfate transporter family protein [Planctomycetota bacterium]
MPTRKPVLPWWAAGLLLGLVMTLAVAVKKPLGVSTQFVVAHGIALKDAAPDYVANHPVLSAEKYQRPGYGWWFDIGLVLGAAATALLADKWRPRVTCAWSRANGSMRRRLVLAAIGGVLILFGSRIAHGCTSGQFASGWAQLSVSVLPFTIGLFGVGILAARWFFPKAPNQEADTL